MFIILLKFSKNKVDAQDHMSDHVAWLTKGFEDGIFHLAGNLSPMEGGGIIAHGITREELEELVNDDPFVKHDVVEAEYIEISASRVSDQFSNFMDNQS